MTDQKLIELYWARKEEAIEETSKKYGNYCGSIAKNILHNAEDAEECVNDTWFKTWNAIPPTRPTIFSAYLAAITRNLSLNRVRSEHTQKRLVHTLSVAYEELEECVPDDVSIEALADKAALGRLINQFLKSIPLEDSCMLIRRYWYMDSVLQIAERYGIAEGSVKSRLHRVRRKLKKYLEEEGYGR